MRRTLLSAAAAGVVGTLVAPALPAVGQTASTAETIHALTNTGEIVTFRSDAPDRIERTTRLRGLASGERVVGIDVRPATQELIGVTTTGRIISINLTGAITSRSQLSQPLRGSIVGIDVNPTVDRLRIVTDANQNLRVDMDTGAVAEVVAGTPGDRDLAFAAGTPLAGQDPTVVAAAYTGNEAGPPNAAGATGPRTTTLFVIDAVADQVLRQAPPNEGTLTPVGGLGVDVGTITGFDVSGNTGVAYVTSPRIVPGGDQKTFLHRVDLTTGRATQVGQLGWGGLLFQVQDIAVAYR